MRGEIAGRWVCAWFCAFLLAGCEGQAPPPTVQEVHLKELAVLFGQYTSSHQGQGPKDESDFKAFIKQRWPKLSQEQVDALFVSPRDQKPYVIMYKVRMGAIPSTGTPIVAHEEVGVEGKHFAADFLGGVEELDKAEIERRLVKAP